MIFQIIGQWVLGGKSPHTGLPVTQTRRLIKDTQGFNPARGVYSSTPAGLHYLYEVGKSYAIQLKRGGKAVGRIPPLTSIRKQDVRQMTHEDAIASGFNSVAQYIETWAWMHDRTGLRRARSQGAHRGTQGEFIDWFQQRPAERYTAWVLDWATIDKIGMEALEREA